MLIELSTQRILFRKVKKLFTSPWRVAAQVATSTQEEAFVWGNFWNAFQGFMYTYTSVH